MVRFGITGGGICLGEEKKYLSCYKKKASLKKKKASFDE